MVSTEIVLGVDSRSIAPVDHEVGRDPRADPMGLGQPAPRGHRLDLAAKPLDVDAPRHHMASALDLPAAVMEWEHPVDDPWGQSGTASIVIVSFSVASPRRMAPRRWATSSRQ